MAPPEMIVAMSGIAMLSGALFGVYRTLNHWIDRRHERLMAEERGPTAGPELRDVRERIDQLEELGFRLQELEERLDFTERVIARQSHAQLPAEDGGT
ncbi:MAG TPA: hypothetical protein VJ992_07850 [Gemmatimonadales bacterium]|jgi:hypothetical protein|nr:hypothetical protein [Gemmatimonadales bacterium]